MTEIKKWVFPEIIREEAPSCHFWAQALPSSSIIHSTSMCTTCYVLVGKIKNKHITLPQVASEQIPEASGEAKLAAIWVGEECSRQREPQLQKPWVESISRVQDGRSKMSKRDRYRRWIQRALDFRFHSEREVIRRCAWRNGMFWFYRTVLAAVLRAS